MADIKLAYASDTNLTITLAALASDTNLLAGRESTAINNTSNLYEDYYVSGVITAGTSPTASRLIEVWAYAAIASVTPTYGDVFDGTDSNETITSGDIKFAYLRLVASINTSNTSDRAYPFAPQSVAALFGGVCPAYFGIFVVHNTGVNLNATGGNHVITVKPVYHTVV